MIVELDSVTLRQPIEVRWDLDAVEEPLRRTAMPVRWDQDLGAWAADVEDAPRSRR